MTRLAKNLIAGTVLATLPLFPAFAGSSSDAAGSQILNGQVMLNSANSTLDAALNQVHQDVGIQSVAAGNTLDVTTMNDTYVGNNQYTSSVDISSDLSATVWNSGGNVAVQGQAVCNSASISTDPSVTAINSVQGCDAVDPRSKAFVDANGVNGSLSLANAAVGNRLEADSNAANMPINTSQYNHSAVVAQTAANVSNVAGTVSITSAAVGNTAQIVHYSTGP